jgi:hypothetical protein
MFACINVLPETMNARQLAESELSVQACEPEET